MTQISIQRITALRPLPTRYQFLAWIDLVLTSQRLRNREVGIRIVDEDEIQELNHQYRQKNYPTNILSFGFEPPPGVKSNFLGDLVICASLVRREAKEQPKPILTHWAHLTIHGTLHLLGYDHENLVEAEQMEELERDYLTQLGFDTKWF